MPANASRRLAAIGAVLALIVLVGCDGYDADIAAVQRARSLPGMTNGELAQDVAGARSTIKWQADQAEGVESDEIIEVTAVISRAARSGKKHKVHLRYRHDRRNGEVLLWSASVDGKIFDLVSMPLNQFKLHLE